MEISDQGALVTGGGSGLGETTARRLAADGAKMAAFDYDDARGSAVAAEIGGFFVKTDVSDEASVEAGFASDVDALGSAPRIVVKCAGIGTAARIVGRVGQLSTDMFERSIRANLAGTCIVMSPAARAMQALDPANADAERG